MPYSCESSNIIKLTGFKLGRSLSSNCGSHRASTKVPCHGALDHGCDLRGHVQRSRNEQTADGRTDGKTDRQTNIELTLSQNLLQWVMRLSTARYLKALIVQPPCRFLDRSPLTL